jgi:hypothetical protein
VRKYVSEDIHTQYVIRAEGKLMKMGYKIYSSHDLPRKVKEILSGHNDQDHDKKGSV